MLPLTEGCSEKYGKRLIGRTDMEDALQRLDKLTQEEARMAVAENLKATHVVDERVRGVANTVAIIDNRVAVVDDRVAGVDDRVVRVDNRIARATHAINESVKGVGKQLHAVDDRVAIIDDKVAKAINGAQITYRSSLINV